MNVEVTLPDGTVLEFPEGMSQDDMRGAINRLTAQMPDRFAQMRDRIAAAKSGALRPSPESLDRAAKADQIAEDQMTLGSLPTGFATSAKVVQGIPFLGQYVDEAMGAINGDQAAEMVRGAQGAMDRQHPNIATAAQIGGGFLGTIAGGGLIGKAVGMVPQVGGLAGKAAVAGVAGGALGATEGAVSGYGAGNDGDRAASAATGAKIGGGLGFALGAAAPLAFAGIRSIAGAIKGRDVSTIARTLGINEGAARVVRDTLAADDYAAATAALKRAGGGAMLADAGEATGQLLDTAASTGGKALVTARSAVNSRATASATRLGQVLDGILGKAEGVRAVGRDIATRTATMRQKAYDFAYGQAIDYAAPQGTAIEGVLARIPSKTLSAAINEANDAMRASGTKNAQILADIAADGSVTFREMPNVQQLDEIKKALDALARDATDAITGKISSSGLRNKSLAADLRAAIADAVPAYNTAVRLGGDKIAEENAANLGRTALGTSVTRETVADGMASASREAKAAAKRGLRSYIDETLANVKTSLTGPDEAVAEARRALREMTSRASREKIVAILGQGPGGTLFKAMDEMAAHLELQANMAANSKTAFRAAGKEAIDMVAEPNAMGSLLQGDVGQATRKVIQFFTGNTGQAQVAQKQQIYAEIADALTRIRGAQADAALATVQRAIAGQSVSTADATRIAKALTAGLSLGAYQLGKQFLPKQ